MTLSTRTVAIANRKGGSGKTTTVVNLSAGLALRGEKVLLVDMDPQANASLHLGVEARTDDPCVYELLLGGKVGVKTSIKKTKVNGLSILPSAVRLAGAELELATTPGRERRLADILAPIADSYTFILVDCPTSFGLLALNAFVACDEIIAPVQTQYFSMMALDQLIDIIHMVNKELNKELKITGLAPTMCDKRAKLSGKLVERLESEYGRNLVRPAIRIDAKLSEAPRRGKPIQLFAPNSNGAFDYTALADDIRVM